MKTPALAASLLLFAVACVPTPVDPPPDAGAPTSDAGVPDAGLPPECEVDGPLGTFALGAGGILRESVELDDDVGRLALRGDGAVFALRPAEGDVVALGTWPNLAIGEVVGEVIPGDVADAFLSPFLALSADAVAAGYTEPFDPDTGAIPGEVAVDVGAGVFVDAPGNFTAAFSGDNLLVNSLGLGDAEGGAVYFVGPAGGSGVFASIPEALDAFSGYTAATPAGIVVVGAFYDGANQLHAASPDQVAAALSGTPLVLDELPLVHSGEVGDIAAVGEGLAVLDAPFGAPVEGVFRFGFGVNAGTVVAGESRPIFERGAADCTRVDFLASFGDDLVVGLSGDSAGRRAVRLSAD